MNKGEHIVASHTSAIMPHQYYSVRTLVESETTSHISTQCKQSPFCYDAVKLAKNSNHVLITIQPHNLSEYTQKIYDIKQLKIHSSPMNDLLQSNLSKLDEFSLYQENWNAYGAQPIPTHIILAGKKLLQAISVQPEVFPTAAESIQFEFERSDGSYLELELRSEGICVYSTSTDGTECEYTEEYSIDIIKEIVENFYGSSLYTI